MRHNKYSTIINHRSFQHHRPLRRSVGRRSQFDDKFTVFISSANGISTTTQFQRGVGGGRGRAVCLQTKAGGGHVGGIRMCFVGRVLYKSFVLVPGPLSCNLRIRLIYI